MSDDKDDGMAEGLRLLMLAELAGVPTGLSDDEQALLTEVWKRSGEAGAIPYGPLPALLHVPAEWTGIILPPGARDFHLGPMGSIGYVLDTPPAETTAPASVDQWSQKTGAEILEDLHAIVDLVRAKAPPRQDALPLFRYEAPMKLELEDRQEVLGFDWTYSARAGGVCFARPMAVCLASIADVGDDKLSRAQQVAQPLKAPTLPVPFKGKRGQKRNRRQRLDGRTRHRKNLPPPPPRRARGEDLSRLASVLGLTRMPGEGDRRLRKRMLEAARGGAETIHAADIPRVGERARERAQRVPFGGAW